MKLRIICEAYDKNLAQSISISHDISVGDLKYYVTNADEDLTFGTWVLKQMRKYLTPYDMQDPDVVWPLVRRLKNTITRFKKFGKKSAIENIYDYDLEQVEDAMAEFDEEDKMHPIKLPGVSLIKTYQDDRSKYYAYSIFDAESLMRMAKGTSWCVAREAHAKSYLQKNPQVMIFKNDNPTTLFALDGSEFKNSGNTDETRPEIIKMFNDIMQNYSDQIRAEYSEVQPPYDKLINKIYNSLRIPNSPDLFDPANLTQAERDLLLTEPGRTVEKYVYSMRYTGGEWPELLEKVKELRESGEPIPRLVEMYYFGLNRNPSPNAVQEYRDYIMELIPQYPRVAITSGLQFALNRKKLWPELEQAALDYIKQSLKQDGDLRISASTYPRISIMNMLSSYGGLMNHRLPPELEDILLEASKEQGNASFRWTMLTLYNLALPMLVNYKCNIINAVQETYDIFMTMQSRVTTWDIAVNVRQGTKTISRQIDLQTNQQIGGIYNAMADRFDNRIMQAVSIIERKDQAKGRFIVDSNGQEHPAQDINQNS